MSFELLDQRFLKKLNADYKLYEASLADGDEGNYEGLIIYFATELRW